MDKKKRVIDIMEDLLHHIKECDNEDCNAVDEMYRAFDEISERVAFQSALRNLFSKGSIMSLDDLIDSLSKRGDN